MAKTYYGYVKRDVADQTDWSAITKSMNDMLTTEAKRREDKKVAIDQASREFGKVLTNAPGSSHRTLNEFWLDGANTIQEARRMQDTLLKSGKLNYKDYIAQRQNLTDNSDDLINLVKGFNGKYESIVNDPNASAFDYAMLQNVQGFGNFSEYQAWANPTDGRLSLGKKVLNKKTGQYELSKDSNDFAQISSLKNQMAQRSAKFDYNKETTKIAGDMGRYVEALKIGAASTIEDVRRRDDYNKQIDRYIDSIMADEFKVASILTDGVAEADYTFDEKEKNIEGKIYVGLNKLQPGSGLRIPELTKSQEAKVRDILKTSIESKLDYIETPAPKFKPDSPRPKSVYEIQQENELKTNVDLAEQITKAMTATTAKESSQSLGVLRDYIDIRGAKKTKDGFSFEIFNNDTKRYEGIPVDIQNDDLKGSVKNVLRKLLGRKVNVDEILESLGSDFFEGKTISDIEAIFEPKQLVNVLDIDDANNIISDPNKPIVDNALIRVDEYIEFIESGKIKNDKELTRGIKAVVMNQGLEDAQIKIELQGAEKVGKRIVKDGKKTAVITSKFLDKPIIIDLETEGEIRKAIENITKLRKSSGSFGGDVNNSNQSPAANNKTKPTFG